jgi:N-acetylmuramoyl-L-alanine amidase
MLPMAAAVAAESHSKAALRAPLRRGEWTSIIIHHSGSMAGSPASIDAQHRSIGLTGLGYHFVIGNGNGLDDGELFIGPRWLDQQAGAHAAGDRADEWNRTSIGICLVGDGRRRDFTNRQLAELVPLVADLCRELGIPKDRVFLHRDIARSEDPGRYFPEAAFREQLAGR